MRERTGRSGGGLERAGESGIRCIEGNLEIVRDGEKGGIEWLF